MTPETVLVTGASSGIGKELARVFAADGSRLILVARSGGALEALAAELRQAHRIEARVLVADLAMPESPGRIMRELQHHGLKVDVLVNNAGFGTQGKFHKIALERQLRLLQVNITAVTHLTHLLLPGMVERRRGGVLNVASTAAFQPGPFMALYFASKAFVLSFSEALAEELVGTGLAVTALCPGPTKTAFAEAAQMKPSRLMQLHGMSAESVAVAGHRAFRRGRAVVVPGFRNRALTFSVRLSPRTMVRKVAGALNRERHL